MSQSRVYAQPKHTEDLKKVGFHYCKKDCRFEKAGKLKPDQEAALKTLQAKDPTIRYEFHP